MGFQEGTKQLEVVEYPMGERGLYVIVHIDDIRYPFQHEGEDSNIETERDMHKDDVKKIKETFKIPESDLIEIKNPTRKGLGQTKCFDSFIEKKVLQGRDPQHKFLMFFLMSVGVRNGQFLLRSNRTDPCCMDGKGNKKEHELAGDCHGRRISNLVRDIQTSEAFSNAPKIFMIQTFTGAQPKGVVKQDGKVKRKVVPDPDDYIPRASDTLVFYLNIEQTLNWVKDNNSNLMVQSLCRTIEEMRVNVVDKQREIKEFLQSVRVKTKQEDHGEKDLEKLNKYVASELQISLPLKLENLSKSWLMDVLMSVSSHMTSKHDDLKPQISSTLRYKLSALKLTAADR